MLSCVSTKAGACLSVWVATPMDGNIVGCQVDNRPIDGAFIAGFRHWYRFGMPEQMLQMGHLLAPETFGACECWHSVTIKFGWVDCRDCCGSDNVENVSRGHGIRRIELCRACKFYKNE